MTLKLSATNAAGVTASRSETVKVDNSQPWVKLSGSHYASSKAGTQYVTAAAGGSPSGIAGIACKVGRGPVHRYSGAAARIAVTGIGLHSVVCTAQNNAVDASGEHAVSRSASWNIDIRRPTLVTALFADVGSGRKTYHRTERIPFGSRTTVGGRLTLNGGAGLSGQTVQVWTAPNNRSGHFAQVVTTKTGASGRWQVSLPPGPSRLVKAVYDGSSTNEPARSSLAKVIVPARVEVLRLFPRQVTWGGTVHIIGQLDGGFLPPAPAGELVRLRLGYGRSYTTYGVKTDVTGKGRFSVSYKFGPGSAKVVRDYWFQECTLPADDYPYAPACSPRITVRVGG